MKGNYLAFDSTSIPVRVKENNLKTAMAGLFDKNRKTKGNPESCLSINFLKHFQKEIRYF